MTELAPGARIGILGAGQLGRMLALAAAELGFDVHVYDPDPDAPAARVSAGSVCARFDDEAALTRFAQSVDVVTLEFENVPVAALSSCARFTPVRPGLKSLEATQDRLTEKRFVRDLGFATAPFLAIDGPADIAPALTQMGGRGILKTRRMGYDGKGQAFVHSAAEASTAWTAVGAAPAVLEGVVAFACEVSVVLARSLSGEAKAFAVTENVHADGILRRSVAPARVPSTTASQAVAIATAIADALGHIGVLAVEFFMTDDGALAVNEIAPRVHNSGHWTQDAGAVSQFTQHVRAVAGWPLMDTSLTGSAEMINVIGEAAADWREFAADPSAKLHLYGKREARPGRKMGHVNRAHPTERP